MSGLERGGIDLWLMQMLRRFDRDRYRMDFMILNEREGALEQEALSLGSNIVRSPQRRKPWRLRQDFANALGRYGPYEVVHGHVHHFNGVVLRLAAWHGVRIRIAHSHSDTRPVETGASWQRRLYVMAMKRWISRCATHQIAVSRSAGEDLFGANRRLDPRCEIIPCGIDLGEFAGDDALRNKTRKGLGLSEDALVIGHVGRFKPGKNHRLLLEIAAAIFTLERRARLLLVGDGELMPEIEARARELEIANRVIFAGATPNVPALMQAMDVFVFPSRYEGLGLVLLEAQASGLPCVTADHLPHDVDVVPRLIRRLPLSSPPAQWASAVLSAASARPIDRAEALGAVSATEFDIERSVGKIAQIYDYERLRLRSGGTI